MKFYLKMMCLAVSFCLFISGFALSAYAEGAPTVCVSNVKAASGENVVVSLSVKNNPGIVSMTLDVVYDDSMLTLKEITDRGVLGTAGHCDNFTSPYRLCWTNDTATQNFTVNGKLVELTFTVNENSENGTVYPISIEYSPEDHYIYDKDTNCINFAVESGSITVDNSNPGENLNAVTVPITDLSYEISGTELYITGYKGFDSDIIIDSSYEISGETYSVTVISESAFESNTDIKSLVLPETLRSVENFAFYNCTSLKSVKVLSKNVTIGERVFGYYYITRGNDGKVEGFKLTGYRDTTSEIYATENDIDFKLLPVFGDINGDGRLNADDAVILKKALLSGTLDEAFDLNKDSAVNIIDLVKLKRLIAYK